MGAFAPILEQYNALRSYTGSLAWAPLVNGSRKSCLALLSNIQTGCLEIVDVDDTSFICGPHSSASPYTRLVVNKDTFWVRLLLFADMGFAESYMLSEVSCSDLTSFFKLFILNKESLSGGSTFTAGLSSSVSGFLRRTNTLANAKLNISAHYDISNKMFEAFLSADMTYSCPIWRPTSDSLSETETLEQAQDRKLSRFIRNTRLKSTDRVLEIGTGWGSMAIKAVQETGCSVTSLTLSIEQKELAEQRIREAGLEEKIKVLLCDYRALEIPKEGPFDKVISIEMLEAVGAEYLETYFACVERLLKKEGGIACFQCITIPESVCPVHMSTFPCASLMCFTSATPPTLSLTTSSAVTSSPVDISLASPS
jgi:cyclopropane-fatty-acyl-phospholipid synthase